MLGPIKFGRWGPKYMFFWKITADKKKRNYAILVEDTGNLIEQVWKQIKFYMFFVLCTFFVKFTVYEIMRFFEFFIRLFLNRNKTILVEDTLNLMTHSRKEIKFSMFFIRDTFFIWLTVFEILRVFWEHGCKNTQDSIFWASISKLVSLDMFLGSRNPNKWVSSLNQQYFRT